MFRLYHEFKNLYFRNFPTTLTNAASSHFICKLIISSYSRFWIRHHALWTSLKNDKCIIGYFDLCEPDEITAVAKFKIFFHQLQSRILEELKLVPSDNTAWAWKNMVFVMHIKTELLVKSTGEECLSKLTLADRLISVSTLFRYGRWFLLSKNCH